MRVVLRHFSSCFDRDISVYINKIHPPSHCYGIMSE